MTAHDQIKFPIAEGKFTITRPDGCTFTGLAYMDHSSLPLPMLKYDRQQIIDWYEASGPSPTPKITGWFVTSTLIGVGPGEDGAKANRHYLLNAELNKTINFGWGREAKDAADAAATFLNSQGKF